jgi:hypothetical protein
MKRAFILITILFSAIASAVVAQDEDTRLKDRVYSRKYTEPRDTSSRKRGKITVMEDERITELDNLKKKYPGQLNGYRVQIFFGDRAKALETKANFTAEHPEIPAYISYLAPNFRLRVGDFRTKLEGEKLKKEIEYTYPGSYLVKDKIELPSLGDEESSENEGEGYRGN